MADGDDRLSTDLQQYYQRLEQQPAPDVTGRVMMATDARTRRMRTWGTVGGGLLALGVAAAVVVLALANHTTTPVGVGPSHSSTPAPTATPPMSAAPATTAPVAVGPPVHGFVPIDVTAVSAEQWWVVGYDGPSCAAASCTRLLHTVDGGSTFTSLATPPVTPADVAAQSLRVRFANPTDGWVVSGAGDVWSTHDGAVTWTPDPAPGRVTDLEASGGVVDAVVCSSVGCGVDSSPVGHDAWSALAASAGHGQLGRLNVNGPFVWAAVESSGGGPGIVLTSRDGGQHFSVRTVCPSALGFANIAAFGPDLVWATCATGMQASAYMSTDGGATYQAVHVGGLANSATIAGVSATRAVIGAQALFLTTDGGATLTTVESVQAQWTAVGFTTPTDGFAFEVTADSHHLWRTNDAGSHWLQVAFP